MRVEYRHVPGEFNPMAACSACGRDAKQTRLSHFCVDLVEKRPVRCDECRERQT